MRDRPASILAENSREEQLVRMVEIDCMLDTLLRNAESGLRRIKDLEPEFYFDDFGEKSAKFQNTIRASPRTTCPSTLTRTMIS
ncbi:Oidioi.mRNA.OKI2018_I69.PAR.g12172.t1.cds [Oikopleura dioica]|uniref:Oidioi.mRNA.OKI2018_I69.PAR.g12172.t1.cds n=1 Tax=Oikopleura dioica TaxID=34765 RepID=A0ABN7RYX3_OIKDI|nr:Oidioi.mRNA.OKI2018_I69.PAR.g12172.t1.cds [Oikopleura dioica]